MSPSIYSPSPGLRFGVLSSIAMLLAACATTTGRGWVSEPHDEPLSVTDSSHSPLASIPATAEPEPRADARPRLNHTVTLGEIDVPPEALRADPALSGGPTVIINSYSVMNVATPAYGYGYASVGYGRALPSFSTGGAPRTSTRAITPGQNWPTITDHGPSFPYHAGPASPWGRPQ